MLTEFFGAGDQIAYLSNKNIAPAENGSIRALGCGQVITEHII